MLYQTHLDSLKTRYISPSLAESCGLESQTSAAAAAEIWGSGEKSLPGDALRIPYFNLDGSEMLGDDGVAYTRHRIFDPRAATDDVKPMRYVARPSSGARIYIPAGINALIEKANKAASGYLVITEGEFKAISAVGIGIQCIAISGVTMWSTDKGSLTAQSKVHPDILSLAKRCGGAVVLADNDASTNQNVGRSMKALAKAISAQAMVPAAYAQVPEHKVGKEKVKLGLDDWIAQKGYTAEHAVTGLLNFVFEKEKDRYTILQGSGYIPLGYAALTGAAVVWSVEKGCIIQVTASQATSPGVLMTVAGGISWCRAAYGSYKGDDGACQIDWQTLGGDLIESCTEAGVYDADSVRGSGVWAGEGDELIINDADGIWSRSGKPVPRLSGGYVYPVVSKLHLQPDTPIATAAEGQDLLAALKTWSWETKSDATVMLGWLALGYLAAAVPWRPHVSLTGPAGTGKSELQMLIERLHGKAGVAIDGSSSEAGVRQYSKARGGLAVLIDESESDGVKVASHLTFLRSASDNKLRLLGSTDQVAHLQKVAVIGLVAGIVPPALSAADQSRFVRLTLTKMSDTIKCNAHELVRDHHLSKALGLRLWRRMIDSWPRLQAAQKKMLERLAGNTRYRDSMAPILAAAFVCTSDEDITDELADALVASIDLTEQQTRMSEAADEQDAMSAMMGRPLDLQIGKDRLQCTLAELCAAAIQETKINPTVVSEHQRALGRHGLRIVDHEAGSGYVLLVSVKSEGLKKLFAGTKWSHGDLGAVLKRVPGAMEKMGKPVSIGGQTVRPLCIELQPIEEPAPKEDPMRGQSLPPRAPFVPKAA